MTKAYKGDHKF